MERGGQRGRPIVFPGGNCGLPERPTFALAAATSKSAVNELLLYDLRQTVVCSVEINSPNLGGVTGKNAQTCAISARQGVADWCGRLGHSCQPISQSKLSISLLATNYQREPRGAIGRTTIVISGSNSHWLRGFGDPLPEVMLTVGFSRDVMDWAFESCELAAIFQTAMRSKTERLETIQECSYAGVY